MPVRAELARRRFRVTGVVQGVGFRPFVYRLAQRHGLLGWVRNTSGSVEIDVEGSADSLQSFAASLRREAPALARVDSIASIEADPAGYDSLTIVESHTEAQAEGVIPADVAACADCLRETNDPGDRRFAYPFTNCTNCGPRFTIVQRVPYDRANTTMSSFPMCDRCAAEYSDPSNRRFHAEPTACPVCGPSVWIERNGVGLGGDPVATAAGMLGEGMIVAVKGLGGFHLACDATNDAAVRELRSRKGRGAKPFALMVKDMAEAERLCSLDATARELLLSPRRPIVLAPRKDASEIPHCVAPGNRNLGIMLPYTPLHALLLEQSPAALVMTSANLSEEPLVFANTTARTRLAELADAFLMHDRDIHVPCDDSVVRPIAGGGAILVRRARGYVPDAVDLPIECECVLGTGAEQKNTFCLARGGKAFPSQHIGDLDTAETFDYYSYAIDHFLALFGSEPRIIAHDPHPGYLSTRWAADRAGARLVGVQHHHAHIAACLAENRRTERCIGLALDGTGYGADGTIWGGEILLADLAGFDRLGHFRQVRMPGGEAAIRDPKRMAFAYLQAAYGERAEEIAASLGLAFSSVELRVMRRQMETGLNSPLTSSAGRLFDAVAAVIGVCRERSYEGQPAVELEMAAAQDESGAYPVQVVADRRGLMLDTLPIWDGVVNDSLRGVDRSVVAGRFHNSLIELLAEACAAAREQTGLNLVALSGGVFQNALMHVGLRDRLSGMGFEVLVHKLVPPNDACISLGQSAAAAAILSGERE